MKKVKRTANVSLERLEKRIGLTSGNKLLVLRAQKVGRKIWPDLQLLGRSSDGSIRRLAHIEFPPELLDSLIQHLSDYRDLTDQLRSDLFDRRDC